MLQQPYGLLIHQLRYHVTQNSSYSVKPLVRLTNILQTHVVQQDLLHDEDGNRFAKLGAGFHDAQAEWDDFGCEQKVDDFGTIVFDKRADHTEGGQAEVLEGPGF